MKRSPMPPRRTPLRPRKPLQRTGMKPGRGPQRARRDRWEADYLAARPLVIARADGRCERCGDTGHHVHHKAGRRHPEANAMHNLVLLCLFCHGHVHGHPAESYRDGWLIHWEDAS